MRKYSIALAAAIVLMIAVTDWLLFLPETDALAWHLAHGFSAELNGVKFKVPIFYQVQFPSSSSSFSSLVMISSNGRIRAGLMGLRVAGIAFASHKTETAPETFLATMDNTWTQMGYKQTAEKLVTLAERQGRCHEYTGPPIHDERISLGDKDIEIACYFGNDVVGTFMGTSNPIGGFYDIVRNAQKVKGHN